MQPENKDNLKTNMEDGEEFNRHNQYETDDKADLYDLFKNNSFFLHVDRPSIKKLLNHDLTGKTIIDYACGSGSSTRTLADFNADKIYGVDISPQMIKKAKSLSFHNEKYDNIAYFAADCSTKLKIGQFDIVFSSHLLEYAETIERLEGFCESMFNSLKPGGFCCGLMDNGFLDPECFGLLRKYGFEFIRDNEKTQTVKFYHGDASTGRFLFQVINYYWPPEVFEQTFAKYGFVNFEWVNPTLDENYEDVDGFYDDYFKYPPIILFKALKPDVN